MAKSRDAVKERYWRGVIRRHGASDLTIRRFCARERIREYQLHWWRRTLRERDRQVIDTRAVGAAAVINTDGAADESRFVALSLPFSAGAPIEIVHPRGHVIRVPAVFDSAVLGRILATLDVAAETARGPIT